MLILMEVLFKRFSLRQTQKYFSSLACLGWRHFLYFPSSIWCCVNERWRNGICPFKQWGKLFDFDEKKRKFLLSGARVLSNRFNLLFLRCSWNWNCSCNGLWIFEEESKADEVDDSFSIEDVKRTFQSFIEINIVCKHDVCLLM